MATQQQTAQLAKKSELVTVESYIATNKEMLKHVLGETMSVDRFAGIFTMLVKGSPQLAKCSQLSLIAAVAQTVQLGLQPGNIGHCHYVPYLNKQKDGTKVLEVQFMVGYKGIVELVNRSGMATIVAAEVVYENDKFHYELGLQPILKHTPTSGVRGKVIGAYAIAENTISGKPQFSYMTREDLDKVQASSRAASSQYSPWNTWYEAMCCKTVIKKVSKLLPLSVEDQRQIASDETIKRHLDVDMTAVHDETQWETPILDADATVDPSPEPENEPQEPEKPEPKPKPQAKQPYEGEREAPDTKFCINEKQIGLLMKRCEIAGWSLDDLRLYLRQGYGIISRKHIMWKDDEFQNIIDFIQDTPKDPLDA